jgi:hypothetical protein
VLALQLVTLPAELEQLRADWNTGSDPNIAAARDDLAHLIKALDRALAHLWATVVKRSGGEAGGEQDPLVVAAGNLAGNRGNGSRKPAPAA